MMYQNKLVVAVKVGGKILREFKEIVKIPFGTEYSLLIKNLNSVRAQVRVSIDGKDMTDGSALVIMPNAEMELERSIRAGNFNTGNRFKFIERTEGIEQARGVQAEDGLIRISYQFEQMPVAMTNYPPMWSKLGDNLRRPGDYFGSADATAEYQKALQTWSTLNLSGDNMTGSIGNSAASPCLNTKSVPTSTPRSAMRSLVPSTTSASVATASMDCSFATAQAAVPVNDAGITVPGSISNQQFKHVSWFALDPQEHVMILKLVGQIENEIIAKPVTVQAKPKCVTCNKVNKAVAKFCTECGTSLTIV